MLHLYIGEEKIAPVFFDLAFEILFGKIYSLLAIYFSKKIQKQTHFCDALLSSFSKNQRFSKLFFTEFLKRELDFEAFFAPLKSFCVSARTICAKAKHQSSEISFLWVKISSFVVKKSDQVQDTYKVLHLWVLLEIYVFKKHNSIKFCFFAKARADHTTA